MPKEDNTEEVQPGPHDMVNYLCVCVVAAFSHPLYLWNIEQGLVLKFVLCEGGTAFETIEYTHMCSENTCLKYSKSQVRCITSVIPAPRS